MQSKATGGVAIRASASDPEQWPWRRAFAWLLFLGPFFFVSYGLANWSAAQRDGVPSVTFAWEYHIPFWPWTIVPYWSLDLLYALSLFVCATRRELDTHAKRLLTAQLVAVTCFIALPLRFSFDQPAVNGLPGVLFSSLAQFDRPFNQLPSLHLALAVIVWALYARKLTGPARLVLEAWLLLVCGSVLTTYQHHFIDIPTGLLLGALCLWVWPFVDEGDGRSIATAFWNPRSSLRSPPPKGAGSALRAAAPALHGSWTRDASRWRLAGLYAAGATLLAMLALYAGGALLWLLWGSVSLLLVALAYAAIGPAAFQKNARGRLSVAARWLFAPYLACAWLNSRAWTWRNPKPVEIVDGVFLGRVPTGRELAASPFVGVVDLTAEFEIAAGDRAIIAVPLLDLTRPSADDLARAAKSIELLRPAGPVLVCCALGLSRSACAIAGWLLISQRASNVDRALAMVRAARTRVVLDRRHTEALGRLTTAMPRNV